jgi:protein SCO1/2
MNLLRGLLLSAGIAASLAACARSAGPAAPQVSLTSDTGKAWNLRDERGHAVLLTFGFTHCADTCPDTLAKLAKLSDRIDASGNEVRIAFVTVDPARDTPAVVHRFLQRFDTARIVGLTGTQQQIDGVENAYHVWAQRIPGRTHGAKGYDVAHSAVIYFIDPRGDIASIHDDDDSDAALAAALHKAAG